MGKPRVIALTGYKGAGKTEVSNLLVAEYGYSATKFAATLKAMLRSIGLNNADLEDPLLKESPHDLLCGRTPRHAMVTLGTEWRDMIHTELWTRLWLKDARWRLDSGAYIVVDDMRFPHEVAAVRAMSGVIVRLDRPMATAAATAARRGAVVHQLKRLRLLAAYRSLTPHASERPELLPSDYTLWNDYGVGELQNNMRQLMQKHFGAGHAT